MLLFLLWQVTLSKRHGQSHWDYTNGQWWDEIQLPCRSTSSLNITVLSKYDVGAQHAGLIEIEVYEGKSK